jgi:hypothetical protein
VPSAFSANLTYTEDTANFPNPERGFFIETGVSLTDLQNARKNLGMTLVRVMYQLDNYTASSLPQSVLDGITSDYAVLRQAGAKMIPRFAYNSGECRDASLSQILSHIDQLTPVLRANSDVIAFIEAGFIGRWGEWHHYQCSDPYNQENNSTRQQVLFKLLDAVPDRMVAVRYNLYKRQIFGTDAPLGPDSAFSGSRRARTGAHNDCFRADITDAGTYADNDIEWEKNFLSQDNRYVPQGGETCGASAYSTCDSAMKDLKRMHWDAINSSYEATVLNSWSSGGCMSTIRKSLGYRLKLSSGQFQDSVRPGNTFSGTLTLSNIGWGKIYNFRGCELVFRELALKNTFRVTLSQDPRRWCMTDSLSTIQIAATIPSATPAGSYAVFLNLPDTAGRLRGRPEYSIRLANKNVWEDSTGFNSLLHTVIVSPTASLYHPGGGNDEKHYLRLTIYGVSTRTSITVAAGSSYRTARITLYSLQGRKIAALDAGSGAPEVVWKEAERYGGVFVARVVIDGIPQPAHYLTLVK